MAARPEAGSANTAALRALTLGLRQVILGSEHFRRSLAAQLGVGGSEMIVLAHLESVGTCTPREVAELLDFSSGSTTAILDRAEAAGFVAREPNAADRRSVLIGLTPLGRSTMMWVRAQSDHHIGLALEHHSPEVLADLAELLRDLGTRFAHAEPAGPPPRADRPVG